jgi:15-cis-phytoene desaturase
MPKCRVAVVGGGVAGLTAAHELALRGFDVALYERNDVHDPVLSLGGKAASQMVTSGGATFAGEHGFRFFPAFYWHTPDTMRRIPLDPRERGARLGPRDYPEGPSVADRLKESLHLGVGYRNEKIRILPRDRLEDLGDVAAMVRILTHNYTLPARDIHRLATRLTVYYTSGNKRRREVWQQQTLGEFLQVDHLSPAGQEFVNDLPKALVAMDSDQGNAKTLLDCAYLLMLDFVHRAPSDRMLSGPTSEAWIRPWYEHLRACGVRFHFGSAAAVQGWHIEGRRVVAARTAHGDVTADFFVCALPIEALYDPCSQELIEASPPLRRMTELKLEEITQWMVGFQYFLRERRPIVHGMINLADSAWGMTAVAQGQFWDRDVFDLEKQPYREVVSAIVTNWKRPYRGAWPQEQSLVDLKRLVAEQLSEYLTPDGIEGQMGGLALLDPAQLVHQHADVHLSQGAGSLSNSAPLLIHPPRFQERRPGVNAGFQNLFLASDYVANGTDLATMEGANEAARLAVNRILQLAGSPAPRCTIVDHLLRHEPSWLRALKRLDDQVYPERHLYELLLPDDYRTGTSRPPATRKHLREGERRKNYVDEPG